MLPLLVDCVGDVEFAGLLAALAGFDVDDVDPDPAPGAAVVAGDALDDVAAEDELVWLAAAGAVAFDAAAELVAGGELAFVCSKDEKLCDGVLADAELAGGAELGPDIISRIAGVMKRAART